MVCFVIYGQYMFVCFHISSFLTLICIFIFSYKDISHLEVLAISNFLNILKSKFQNPLAEMM